MPKPAKKLPKWFKSHYAYETRKNVDLSQLPSLRLESAWPFIRTEVEREIGKGELVCVPYITEASCYSTSSVFRLDERGNFQPLGKLESLIDKTETDPDYAEWLKGNTFDDKSYKYPHESVKITLQDEQTKNKVRVIMLNLYRSTIPNDRSPEKRVCLKKDILKGATSVHIITDVLMAKTVEFRATMGIASRIFHLGNPTPLVFTLNQYKIDDNGHIIEKISEEKCVETMEWNRVDKHDRLYPDHPEEN